MSDTEILEAVKNDLGITSTYQDNTIKGYIDEVKHFLIDGGVDEEIVNSENAKGIISRGVSDLWNYGSGGTSLSPYFIQRAIQLASKSTKTKSEIKEFTERIETLETTSANHEERIDNVEDTLETVNENLSNITDRITATENALNEQGESIDDLNETVNTHTEQISNINDTLNTHGERITNVEENKADTEYVDELVGDIGEEIDMINGEIVGDENV